MIHIVLFEPEIPANTGNIIRTCMAFNLHLHLIEPLGFSFDEKHLKRAGMDYIDKTEINFYPNFDSFKKQNEGNFVYFTRYGLKSFEECNFKEMDPNLEYYLIFGKESTGIPKEILKDDLTHAYRIPMRKDARSLNLSNCVAIGAFEALRQLGFDGLSKEEVIKGRDWLLK